MRVKGSTGLRRQGMDPALVMEKREAMGMNTVAVPGMLLQ